MKILETCCGEMWQKYEKNMRKIWENVRKVCKKCAKNVRRDVRKNTTKKCDRIVWTVNPSQKKTPEGWH